MSLDEFLKECEKNGSIPLSYRSHKEFVNGSRTVEYENPKYARAKERLADILGSIKRTGDPKKDDIMDRLYGEEVVIRTKYGYHHGTLQGFDGKTFMLSNYLFSRKPMDIFDYSTEFFYGDDTAIPADGVISISKIPIMKGAYSERGN